MTLSRGSSPFLARALRGAVGSALLLLGACSVGIDDRPVPPEAIPGVAFQEPATTAGYGTPSPIVRAAATPAYSAAPARSTGGSLVWQTGAQPVAVERAALPPPDGLAEEAGEQTASGEEAPIEPAVEASGDEPAVAATARGEVRAFRLAPFVGLEGQAAAPLREAMLGEAETAGIRLSEGRQDLVLKGYLSSMQEGGATVLTYVWDVYDAAGTRLTRIGGQQALTEGGGSDPLRIDPGTAREVARRTIAALRQWQPQNSG